MKHLILIIAATSTAFAADQNPSPMVEHTREHPRLVEQHSPGKRTKLALGTLFIPKAIAQDAAASLLVFMHGGTWIPEVAAGEHKMASICIQLGNGYAPSFEKSDAFSLLVDEAARAAHMQWSEITVGGWSAGCQGIRQILRSPANADRIARLIFIDGIHTSYTTGKPGPLESDIDATPLSPIVSFCREAIVGRKRVIITHSQIFPGTFASTTETAACGIGSDPLTTISRSNPVS